MKDSLTTYKDDLIPLDQLDANLENYSQSWLDLGTVDGEVLGVFVKSDIKSIVWYSPLVFETEGYTVPTTWDEFVALVDQISADGGVPLSMGMESGGATGWTGTDFVQDIIAAAYESSDESMRVSAVFAMGRSMDATWVEPVLAELSNRNPAMRCEAARACGELEIKEAISPLIRFVSDPDPEVQAAAIEALGQIGGQRARRVLERRPSVLSAGPLATRSRRPGDRRGGPCRSRGCAVLARRACHETARVRLGSTRRCRPCRPDQSCSRANPRSGRAGVRMADPDAADVPRLELEIDHIVYELHDLTPEEVEIVEGKSNNFCSTACGLKSSSKIHQVFQLSRFRVGILENELTFLFPMVQ